MISFCSTGVDCDWGRSIICCSVTGSGDERISSSFLDKISFSVVISFGDFFSLFDFLLDRFDVLTDLGVEDTFLRDLKGAEDLIFLTIWLID